MKFLYVMELHSVPKSFYLNFKGLFDKSVLSLTLTKNEYGSALIFYKY